MKIVLREIDDFINIRFINIHYEDGSFKEIRRSLFDNRLMSIIFYDKDHNINREDRPAVYRYSNMNGKIKKVDYF